MGVRQEVADHVPDGLLLVPGRHHHADLVGVVLMAPGHVVGEVLILDRVDVDVLAPQLEGVHVLALLHQGVDRVGELHPSTPPTGGRTVDGVEDRRPEDIGAASQPGVDHLLGLLLETAEQAILDLQRVVLLDALLVHRLVHRAGRFPAFRQRQELGMVPAQVELISENGHEGAIHQRLGLIEAARQPMLGSPTST